VRGRSYLIAAFRERPAFGHHLCFGNWLPFVLADEKAL
jgi:hypothetical protein